MQNTSWLISIAIKKEFYSFTAAYTKLGVFIEENESFKSF